jgi:hypothetical protein
LLRLPRLRLLLRLRRLLSWLIRNTLMMRLLLL